MVELSVVLVVISITLAGTLTLMKKKTEFERQEQTTNTLEEIEKQLAVFVADNQRLPCPADGSDEVDATSSNSFGIEVGLPDVSNGCVGSNFDDNSQVFSGVVPTKTLNLPDDYMFDGWGRRITYAVDFYLAHNNVSNVNCDGTTSTRCLQYTSAGTIRVNDENGSALVSNAVYVLVSHGKNGHGAYGYHGSSTRIAFPGTSDTDEQENSGDDSPYDNIFVQKDETSTFDDSVVYKTKSQLLTAVNAVTDASICTKAKAVIDDIGTSSCNGAASETVCLALATKIFYWCLDE